MNKHTHTPGIYPIEKILQSMRNTSVSRKPQTRWHSPLHPTTQLEILLCSSSWRLNLGLQIRKRNLGNIIGGVGNNRLLKSKTNSLGPRQNLTSFLTHLCMKPTPLQCARRKANQIFLGCLLIKYLQPSKYKNPQSPQLSPEASKV